MKATVKLLTLSLLAIAASSCVSSKKYHKLQADNAALEQRYNDVQGSLAKSQSDGQPIQALLAQAQKNNAELKASYAALQKTLDNSINQNTQGNVNISKLVDQINASNKYIRELVQAKNRSDSLNLLLATNLTRSLTPVETDQVNVKVLKGVVYISLSDNMLFKSGSYEVNDRAMQTLGKIAKILKDYSDYDVLVEGNTDPVPISRPNIRNNWDLTVLRASSLVQLLQDKFGVDPTRLTAGGRGEYNPIADNETAVGRQRNRRTEIIITPKLDQFMGLIGKAPKTDSPSAN